MIFFKNGSYWLAGGMMMLLNIYHNIMLEWPRKEFRLLETVLSYFLFLFLFVICFVHRFVPLFILYRVCLCFLQGSQCLECYKLHPGTKASTLRHCSISIFQGKSDKITHLLYSLPSLLSTHTILLRQENTHKNTHMRTQI